MRKYACTVCGFIYDEAAGMPDAGIAPGTRWEALPDDWRCPLCGAPKALFEPMADATPTPEAVPSTQKTYACAVCGYIYDEAVGAPDTGLPPGARWADIPDDWTCPICGAPKSVFEPQQRQAQPSPPPKAPAETRPERGAPTHRDEPLRELTTGELAALCSNLARGCEKQYLAEESALFTQLADFFGVRTPAVPESDAAALLALIRQDLESGFAAANVAASDRRDRGALRALVWSEKVTRILNALLARYEAEGEGFLTSANVYVCEICGFVYVGDSPPELCPVCKVPSWKIAKVERR